MNNRRGSVFAVVLVFVVFFLAMSTAMLRLTKTRIVSSVFFTKAERARNMAEAGLEDALRKIKENVFWYAGFTNKVFEDGYYTVEVDTTTSPYSVSSRGYVKYNSTKSGLISKQVSANIDLQTNLDIFNNSATIGGGGIKLSNSANINGDVDTDGAINVGNSATIDGDAEAGGTIGGAGSVTGDQVPNSTSTVLLPAVNEAKYLAEAQAGGTHTGNLTITSGNSSIGPLYISGNLTIKNTANVVFGGTIFVGGTVDFNNSTYISGKVVLYGVGDMIFENGTTVGVIGEGMTIMQRAGGTIDIQNTAILNDVLIYAPGSTVVVINSTQLSGAVIADSLEMKNTSEFTWKPVADLIPTEVIIATITLSGHSWSESW